LHTGLPSSFQCSRLHTLQGQAKEWEPPPHAIQLVIRRIVSFSSSFPLQSLIEHLFSTWTLSIYKTLFFFGYVFFIILYIVYVKLVKYKKRE
jgi:hypothetical protein